MAGNIASRLLQMIPVLLAILTINFAIIHLAPGDPAVVMAGPTASAKYVASIRHEFGLDKSLAAQYVSYVWNVAHGNLGTSVAQRRPVTTIIRERIGPTLLLMLPAIAISLVLGVGLATRAGLRRGGMGDRVVSMSVLGLYSIPVFWLAVMLVFLFAIHWKVFPVAGMSDAVHPTTGVSHLLDVAKHMVLPITAMVCFYLPQFYQVTRASVIETLEEDYVKTYTAAGMEKSPRFFGYVLKNAALPTFTLAGLWLGFSLTGAVLIEVIFAWPGLGSLLLNATLARDYPVLLGTFLVASAMIVIIAFVTDVTYMFLDPRIRYGRRSD